MPGQHRVTVINNSIIRNEKEANKPAVVNQLLYLNNGEPKNLMNGDHALLPVIVPKVLHFTNNFIQNGVHEDYPNVEAMKRITQLDELTRRCSNSSSDLSTNGSNGQFNTRSSSERCFHCKGSLLGGSSRLCKTCCESEVPTRRIRQCLICSSVMPDEFFHGHLLSHHSNLPFKCTYCQKGFGNVDEIREHAKIHLAENERKWQTIQKEIMKKGFKKHSLSAKSVNRAKQILYNKDVEIVCQLCGKHFTKVYHKQRHLSDVHGALNYSCTDCQRPFPSVRYLNKHLKQTVGKKFTLKCHICAKLFRSNACLFYHKIEIHGKKSKKKGPSSENVRPTKQPTQERLPIVNDKQCYICKKSFTTIYHTRRHIRDLHSTTVFQCEDCKKKFPCQRYLRMHLQKPLDQKLKCNICMKEFQTSACFQYHKMEAHGKKKRLMPVDNGQKGSGKKKISTEDKKENVASETTGESKMIRFTCKYCAKGFTYRTAYRRHMTIHLNGVGRKCSSCGVVFQKKSELSEHIRVNHAEKSLFTVINKLGALAKQKKVNVQKVGSKVAKPTVVPSESQNSSPTSGKMHLCNVCNKSFSSRSNLYRHKLIHMKNQNLYKCAFCEKVFSNEKHKRQHEYNHKPTHVCLICGRSFPWPYLLTKHALSHSKGKPAVLSQRRLSGELFKCTMCKSTFKTRIFYELHVEKAHKQTDKSAMKTKRVVRNPVADTPATKDLIKCSHCRRSFLSKALLNRHVFEQHKNQNQKGLSCKTCGQKFVRKSNLVNHLKLAHVVRKPFRCKKCNIPLKSKIRLIAHNSKFHPKTSSGFECEKCGERFYRNVDLARHQLVHSDKKGSFKCPKCDILFKSKKAWLEHDSIHKPFKCETCEKRFSKNSLLTKHRLCHPAVTKEAPGKQTSCDVCKSDFATRASLLRHRSNIHGLKQ